MVEMLNSKIHRAIITDANLSYEGSISIAKELCDAAHLMEFQKVTVVDIDNGSRFETYVILSEIPGCVCVNGAAARLVTKGDRVIIMSYHIVDEHTASRIKPMIIKVNENNSII